MRSHVWTLALAVGCTAGSVPTAPAPSFISSFDEGATEALLAVLRTERDRQQIPELLVHLESPGGRMLRAAVGTRGLGDPIPAELSDCVRVGSVTKLLVAVATMKLVERGAITLKDHVGRWLPMLPAADAITIEQLLSHHAGVPDVLGAGSLAGATMFRSRSYARADLLAKISSRRPFAPGEQFQYSNGNYIALGMVLEEASHEPIHALLAEHIIGPAGLSRTALLPDGPAPDCLLMGYDRDLVPFGHEVRPSDNSFATLAWTSGALSSTVDDLAALVRGVRNATLVSRTSLASMLPSRPATGKHHEVAVGLGLFRFEFGGRRFVGHEGLFVGSQALAGWAEDDGTLVVLIGNRSSFDEGPIVGRLLAAGGRTGK